MWGVVMICVGEGKGKEKKEGYRPEGGFFFLPVSFCIFVWIVGHHNFHGRRRFFPFHLLSPFFSFFLLLETKDPHHCVKGR
jgi:hypothetical protein